MDEEDAFISEKSNNNKDKDCRELESVQFISDGMPDTVDKPDMVDRASTWAVFHYKMKHNQYFRIDVFYTACIYSVYFGMGWQYAQIGPAFHDLQTICGVDLERGSWIFTSSSIGYAAGSLLISLVIEKLNRKLFFAALHFALAGTFLAIPWCSDFWLMICMYVTQGMIQGSLEPVGYTEILSKWKKNGRLIFLGLNFIYCIGGILSPLTTAPFLLPIKNDSETEILKISPNITINDTFKLVKSYITTNASGNLLDITSHKQTEESKLVFAFLLTAIICFSTSISFLMTYCLGTNRKQNNPPSSENIEEKSGSLPSSLKYAALLLLGLMLGLTTSIDEVFLYYLPEFCVRRFGWEQGKAALILSVVYITATTGSAVGIVVVKFLSSISFTGAAVTIGLLSMICFTLSAVYTFEIGIWLFAGIQGFAKINMMSLIYTWTSDYITPVTGKISSYLVLSNMLGNSLNPLLMGYLVEEVDAMWFAYLFVIQASALLVLFIILALVTKCIIPKYRISECKPENTTTLVEK